MSNIFKILKLSKPFHKLLISLSVLILIAAVLQQLGPILIKQIVDQIDRQLKTNTGSLNQLYWLIGMTFGVNLIYTILSSVNQRLGDYIAGRLRKFLTEKFYEKIFTLPQKYFDSEISGKIVNQLSRGIASIQEFSTSMTNFILPALLQAVFTLGVLAYYNWQIAILAFIIFPIYIAISSYSTKIWGKEEVKKNQLEDISRGRIQEVISNIRLVKGFNTQLKEHAFISEKMTQIIDIYDKQSLTYHFLNFGRNFGLELILIIISVIVFRNTFRGSLSIGEMVLILELLNRLRWPLFGMSWILEQVQHAESGTKEFFEILTLESTEKYISAKPNSKLKSANLEFKDVTFKYNAEQTVLTDVNFSLGKNETIALVGHSGAGKSTVVNLILKFYEPTAGEIFINGSSYKKLDHQTVRQNISLVFQDSELFSSTIRENVAYGISNPQESEIVSALKKANAYDFVMKLPKGLDAEIGERGVRLSGGQKQRIQIARAVMHNSPILILDEATSSLDSKSEKLVQDALENLMKNKLVIIIAHRFSTIQNVDRILAIDDGKIVDSGTVREMATRPGIYSELLKYQIEGNKKLLAEYGLR